MDKNFTFTNGLLLAILTQVTDHQVIRTIWAALSVIYMCVYLFYRTTALFNRRKDDND